MDQSIQDLLAATLSELGIPAPTAIIQTMLMRGGYFVGWKLRFDGGCAVLQSDVIELYDEQGKLLTTITLKAKRAA